MKLSALVSTVAAVSLLLTAGSRAGTLSSLSGPSFNPINAFSNNSIQASVVHNPAGVSGDVLKFTGSSDVAPNSSPAPTISVSGSYSANANDVASLAYDFTVDLNSATPVTLTIQGSVTVFSAPIPFNTQIVLTTGTNEYTGQIAAGAFPFATSGTFNASLSFNFNSVTTTSLNHLAAAQQPVGGLNIDIHQLDFQIAPQIAQVIPEPSSLAFLSVGFSALLLTFRRRSQSARA